MVKASEATRRPSQRSRPQRRGTAAATRVDVSDVGRKMANIFNDGQSPDKHPECVERMNKLQRECARSTRHVQEFYNQLKTMIKFTLFAHDSRSPFGQNCIEFVIKYLLNFRQTDSDDNEDIEDQRQEFLESVLIDAVIPLTAHLKDDCRVNACNFIRCLSEELKEINDETFNTIVTYLLTRTADPKGSVRAAAFQALHRFQSVSDDNDLCAQAIYCHLTSDPDPDVRLCCLKVMASSKNSISYFIDATRDVKDIVRKTAYIQIAQKFDIKSFTIEQRLKILKNGLKDRSQAVRKVVESVLINSWFNSMTNPNISKPKSCDNFVQLLIALDIQTDIELIEKMTEIHFKSLMEEKAIKGSEKTKFDQLVEDFRTHYLTEQKVFKEELTVNKVEEIFLWRFLCEFCKNNKIVTQEEVVNNDKEIFDQTGDGIDINIDSLTLEVPEEGQQIESNEPRFQKIELFETLVPDVPFFCEYLQNFVQYIASQELTISSTLDFLDLEFIFKQLMKMSLLLDIGDDAQRNHLVKALHLILMNDNIGNKFHSYVTPIMKTLAKKAFNDNVAYLDFTAEIISEIYNSIHTNNSDESESLREETIAELEQKKIQLLEDIDKLNKDVQEFENEGKISEVEELNKQIRDIQVTVQELNEKIATNTLSQSSMASQTQSMPSLTDYPKIQAKCLDILSCCLEFGDFGEVNAVMQNHIEKVCLPGFLSERPEIRCMATRCLGLFCFVCAQYFKQYLHFMIEIFNKDTETVKLMALQSLFDCLCEHGLNIFGKTSKDKEPSLGLIADDQKKDFVKQFHDFFDERLLSKNVEIRQITIQGICKLLLHSKMYSPELLSRLAIIWFTPDEDEAIVQLIGEFLRLYSLAESQGVIIGQSALEEAFLITLQTISDENLKLDSERLIKIFLNYIKEDNHITLADKLCKTLLELDPVNNKLAEDYLLSAISQLNLVEMENRDLKRFDNNMKKIEEKLENIKSKKIEKKLTLIKNNIRIRGQQLEADSAFANDFRSEDENEDNNSVDEEPDRSDQTFEPTNDTIIVENVQNADQNELTNIEQNLNISDQNEEGTLQPVEQAVEESELFLSPVREQIQDIISTNPESDSEAESYRTCPESPEQKRRRLSSDPTEGQQIRDAFDSENIVEKAIIEETEEEMMNVDDTNETNDHPNEDQSIDVDMDDNRISFDQNIEIASQDPNLSKEITEEPVNDQTIEQVIEATTE